MYQTNRDTRSELAPAANMPATGGRVPHRSSASIKFMSKRDPRFKEIKEELERRSRKRVEEDIVQELFVFLYSYFL